MWNVKLEIWSLESQTGGSNRICQKSSSINAGIILASRFFASLLPFVHYCLELFLFAGVVVVGLCPCFIACLLVDLSVCPHACLLSLSLSVCLWVCLSVGVCVYLWVINYVRGVGLLMVLLLILFLMLIINLWLVTVINYRLLVADVWCSRFRRVEM